MKKKVNLLFDKINENKPEIIVHDFKTEMDDNYKSTIKGDLYIWVKKLDCELPIIRNSKLEFISIKKNTIILENGEYLKISKLNDEELFILNNFIDDLLK